MVGNLSLTWDAHQSNICNGLRLSQQRGEFVDMTLAADGHHVKVHQMILSLASPYIKDLIATAECPHPVIFLNNISYTTLSGILEYVYTGEVLISKEALPELIAAGRALHIKGLKELRVIEPRYSSSSSADASKIDNENYDMKTATLQSPDNITDSAPSENNDTTEYLTNEIFINESEEVKEEQPTRNCSRMSIKSDDESIKSEIDQCMEYDDTVETEKLKVPVITGKVEKTKPPTRSKLPVRKTEEFYFKMVKQKRSEEELERKRIARRETYRKIKEDPQLYAMERAKKKTAI